MQPYRTIRMIVLMYDVGCQYIKKFGHRLKDLFSPEKILTYNSIESTDLPEHLIAGIGKYHTPMHTADCCPFFSLNNLPGAADFFGKNVEQKWAEIEGISRATKEMAPGHQHNKLNNQNSDANTKLVHGMGESQSNVKNHSLIMACSRPPHREA